MWRACVWGVGACSWGGWRELKTRRGTLYSTCNNIQMLSAALNRTNPPARPVVVSARDRSLSPYPRAIAHSLERTT
eukprot:19371-Pelagococcus_subviridis.AAC.2